MSPISAVAAVELLTQYGSRLEPVLSAFLDRKVEKTEKISPFCRDMVCHIKEFTLRGGKRIRPALIYYGYKCFAEDNEDQVVYASMSIELLHSYLLIHDDIMDGDGLRRNRPTVHRLYEDSDFAANYRSREAYGTAMAIIAGDIACGMAVDAIATAGFPADRQLRAIQKISQISVNVGYGQALDVLSSCKAACVEEDPILVNRLKTTYYTIEGPLHLGGMLAGASDRELDAFQGYAIPLGQAFQIQDDILGMYGGAEQLGKPIGSDIKEGKKTLLIVKALEMADKKDAAIIKNALGNPTLAGSQIASVRTAVRRSGALEYSRDMAASLVGQAKAAVPTSIRPEGREFLLGIADYLVSRDK